MGIRIHKVLGYGLGDLIEDPDNKYKLKDPRLNPDGIICSNDPHWLDYESYKSWLETNSDSSNILCDYRMELQFLKAIEKDDHIYTLTPKYHVIRDGEDGLSQVLCVYPMTNPDWYRSGDSIDWYEETYLRLDATSQANHVNWLPEGIYPYNGLYMDSRSGEQHTEISLALQYRRLMAAQSVDDILNPILDELAQKLGYTSNLEGSMYMAPIVPETIRSLLLWGEAFVEPAIINQLRPMLYVYWA